MAWAHVQTVKTDTGAASITSASTSYTAGTSLASPYNVDMFGCTRTNWTRGALEFPSW